MQSRGSRYPIRVVFQLDPVTSPIPSRPATAAQVKGDIAKVLQHLDVAEAKYNDSIFKVERQIQWVKAHETWNEDVEALNIISDLEIRLEMYIDKVNETQSLKNSIRSYFMMH